jgi:hypothetical protein
MVNNDVNHKPPTHHPLYQQSARAKAEKRERDREQSLLQSLLRRLQRRQETGSLRAIDEIPTRPERQTDAIMELPETQKMQAIKLVPSPSTVLRQHIIRLIGKHQQEHGALPASIALSPDNFELARKVPDWEHGYPVSNGPTIPFVKNVALKNDDFYCN